MSSSSRHSQLQDFVIRSNYAPRTEALLSGRGRQGPLPSPEPGVGYTKDVTKLGARFGQLAEQPVTIIASDALAPPMP